MTTAQPVTGSQVTGGHCTSMAVLLLGGASRLSAAGAMGKFAAVATK